MAAKGGLVSDITVGDSLEALHLMNGMFDRGSDIDEYLSVPEFYGPLPPGDVYAMGANATVVARLTGADPHRVREVARTAVSELELPPAQELYEQISEVMGVEA